MDTDKILIELELNLKEKLNSVSKNETYSKLIELYPAITVDEIISNLNNDLLTFNTFTEIASLVERYKQISDYIANNYVVRNLNNLFSALGEELLADNIKQLDEIKAQQKRIKQHLDDLGFKKISSFEKRQHNKLKQVLINKIALGKRHTVGLKSDGTVVAVGDNEYGQCNVSDWIDIIAISVSEDITIGLRTDGTVVAVGDNKYGQCDVNNWTDIIAVSVAYAHTVGLKSDGSVVAVGDNKYGQCDVRYWLCRNFVAVFVGAKHTVGLREDGTIAVAGDNQYGECNVGNWKDIVALSVGLDHIVGLRTDGTVVAAGSVYRDDGDCDVDDWNLLG